MEPYIIFFVFMLGVLRLFMWQIICYRLRIYHKDIYFSMGKPEAMGVFRKTNAPRIRKFIYKMEFKGVNDKAICFFSWAAIAIDVFVLSTFVAAFIYLEFFY